MKALIALALALPVIGQRIDFTSLSRACVPSVNPVDLWAITKQESGGHVLALSVNRPAGTAFRLGFRNGRAFLLRQPRSQTEALQWVNTLAARGLSVSIGLLQVNSEVYPAPAALLDGCTNLRIGWAIFERFYASAISRYGRTPRATVAALSAYNSGSFTASNDYARSVLGNLTAGLYSSSPARSR